jgi:hypothetical protein
MYKHAFGKLPLYYGFDPNGVHSAVKLIGSGNYNFNFVHNTPFHWIAPAFIGYRGSGMWHFNVDGINPTSLLVTRTNQLGMVASETKTSTTAGTISNNSRFYLTRISQTHGGMALTNQNTNAGLSVLCPNYTSYKFQSTKPGNTSLPPSTKTANNYDGAAYDSFMLSVLANDSISSNSTVNYRLQKYWGIGTDFNLFFFLNVPTFYRIVNMPTAN